MKKGAPSTSIKVFTRLRPLNKLEKEQGGECCVQYTDKSIKVKVAGVETPYDFGFDGIFGPECSQKDMFDQVAKPVIDGLIEGYNGTIFAYGQTSSGKTFTMEGPDIIDEEGKLLGIVPRMMRYLFDLIMNSSEDIEFQVKVSFLELYNEKLQDLLDPRKNNLQIKEDKSKGIFVQDVTEVYVNSAEQMRQIHKSGSENKTTAATRMNERSSRSHSIFILNVSQKDTKTETTKISKLFFVDLAGSEKIAKTNVTGQQLEEAKNINKSLTALGLVINALTEKDKGHVPYRDSKLTRMLQESLGGNSATSLILACSMCTYNDKETVDTLRFGNRAKSIKNTPVANVERSAKELTLLLNAAEKKIAEHESLIEALQQQLGGGAPVIKAAAVAEAEKVEAKEEGNGSGNEEKEEKAKSTQKAGGQSSMAVFKYQMELANLKEQIQELQGNNKDLEAELAAKNQEIYDLNGKVMQYESQLNEFSNKNVLALEEYQVQFEKLYHENQEKAMVATKFKRAINRLKSDLSFMTVSKHLKVLEGHDSSHMAGFETETTINSESSANKDELIVNSIQKTIEILEEIERDIDQDEKKGTSNEDVANMIEALMKNSPTNSANNKTDLLINSPTDEDLKPINWNDESVIENREVSDLDSSKLDASRIDGEGEFLQFQGLSEEDKVADLQALVMGQRKTITNLTKLNAELEKINQKHQAAQEKNIQTYKTKLDELQKLNLDKVKEYESKLMSIKSLLERKVREIDENKMFYDRYLEEKTENINELKEQNEKLQALIENNDVAVRNYELENAVREVTKERKKLAQDIMKLRKEADEKDDQITTKTAQIELLQNNLGLAAKELKILKQLKPAVEGNIIDGGNNGTSIRGGKSSGKNKNTGGFTLFDKHVVKPIRGGGGDANNFARNNQLVFEKKQATEEKAEEKVEKEKTTNLAVKEVKDKLTGLFGFGGSEESKSSKNKEKEKEKEDQSFKKFDDLLKKEKVVKEKKEKKEKLKEGDVEGQAMSTEPDQDEDLFDMGNVQQKLRRLTNQGVKSGAKGMKSLVSGVKNFFS